MVAFPPHHSTPEAEVFTGIPGYENASLYTWHEIQNASLSPVRLMANAGKHWFHNPINPLSYTPIGRQAAAASELVETADATLQQAALLYRGSRDKR